MGQVVWTYEVDNPFAEFKQLCSSRVPTHLSTRHMLHTESVVAMAVDEGVCPPVSSRGNHPSSAADAAPSAVSFTYDDENQELFETLRSELTLVTKEEARVEATLADNLDSLLSVEATKAVPAPDGKQLALQMEGIEKAFATARLTGLTDKVTALAEHVYSCQELADKMSCSVRKLDERQMRVQHVLALVEDIINLKTCAEGVERALEEGDLPDATSYVRQFHSIEGSAAKASDHYDFMVSSEARLKETVMRKVQLAVSRSNLEDVFKFCPLLGPLGLAEEGAKIYESFAERLLKESLDPLVSEAGKLQAVQLLPKIYNVAAGFLQHHLPLVAHGFKQVNADVSLIRLVQRECEDAAIPVIKGLIKARGLTGKCRMVANASPGGIRGGGEDEEDGGARREEARGESLMSGDLDALMDELALVIQHTESYDRFVRYLAAEAKKTRSSSSSSSIQESGTEENKEMVVLPAATDLNGAIAEVSGPFAVLEHHLMRSSIHKALEIDELPPLAPLTCHQGGLQGSGIAAASAAGSGREEEVYGPGAVGTGSGGAPQTSSCVDDTFYVVRRCARRALVTGHAGTASAIVNYINSTLLDELMPVLSAKVRSLREMPLPVGLNPATGAAAAPSNSSGGGGRKAGAAIVAAKQHWSRVKGGFEAGLETAQQLTAVAAGSLMGGAGIGLVGGGAGTITYYPATEAKLALDRLVMLNNLAACAVYTIKLQQELMAEVPSIFQDDPSTDQLMVCLGEMSETSRQFEQACEEGLQHVGALIKPKIRGFLQDALGVQSHEGGGGEGGGEGMGESKVSYELNEEDFAGNEAVDPWVHRFVEFLGGVLGPIRQRLSDQGFESLKMALVDYLVKRLEYLLMRKSFTQLGGLQFDKDLRCLLAFFPSGGEDGGRKGGRGGMRERFARLMQMNQLLNLDVPTDIVDVFGGPLSKLTSEEALNVMKLRVDWEETEIGKAQQHLLTASSGAGGTGDGGFL